MNYNQCKKEKLRSQPRIQLTPKNQWLESLLFSPFEAFIPTEQKLIWLHVFRKACLPKCIYIFLFKFTLWMRPGDCFTCFHSSFHLHSHSGCVKSSQSTGPMWGSLGMKALTQSGGGAYDLLLEQHERAVSWNSQEAAADWWKRIYSEVMGKLYSLEDRNYTF